MSGIEITVVRKRIKHLHLRVRLPDGRVTMSAPRSLRLQEVQRFAAERVEWIVRHQERLRALPPRQEPAFVDGEEHLVWGHPHTLTVNEARGRPQVILADGRITLSLRPGSDAAARQRVMLGWHKALMHDALARLIPTWEERVKVRLAGYSLRRMRSRWGTCNYRTRHIRLNTELATRPAHLLEYVLVHELVHLLVPNHGPRFVALMTAHYPEWRSARADLAR